MRRQLIWGQAILLATTFSMAAPGLAHADRHQPPAHAPANGHHKAKKPKHHKGEHEPRAWDRRFDGLDHNHDRVVSRSEWNGDDRSFDSHDWNHDGVLSGDELMAGATRPTAPTRATTAPRPTAPSRTRTSSPSPRARTESDEVLFARRDTNHDGRISRSEFPGSTQEFDRLDVNKDGVLSPYEYGVGR